MYTGGTGSAIGTLVNKIHYKGTPEKKRPRQYEHSLRRVKIDSDAENKLEL